MLPWYLSKTTDNQSILPPSQNCLSVLGLKFSVTGSVLPFVTAVTQKGLLMSEPPGDKSDKFVVAMAQSVRTTWNITVMLTLTDDSKKHHMKQWKF